MMCLKRRSSRHVRAVCNNGRNVQGSARSSQDYKPFVPRIVEIRIPAEFIGAVIGKGGETIQAIQKETGAIINIDEVPIEVPT